MVISMLLLILALLNWIFLSDILELVIAIIIFIIGEVKRRNGDGSKATIAAQFISALIIVAYILLLILGLVIAAR